VHKNRSLPEPFPALRPACCKKLIAVVDGLPWAALSRDRAMVFAIMAAAAALGLNFQPISRADRIRSLVVLLLSGALWLGGLLLGAILLLHVI